MFYSMAASAMLAQLAAEERSFSWDLVVRCRFDLMFHRDLNLAHDIEPRTIYVPSFDDVSVNDCFAYGRPEAMIDYSFCYSAIDQYLEEGAGSCNECILHHHLKAKKLKVALGSLPMNKDGFELWR
jgi:hypothetical protein